MGSTSNVVIGLGAAIVAALMLSGGLVLQALDARAVADEHGLRLSLLRRLVRRPRWLAGTVIGYLAFPFQILAFAHIALVVVQPVQACGLLLILVAGARLMDERVGAVELAGVLGILVGVGMVAWGAPATSDRAVSEAAFAGATLLLIVSAFAPVALGQRCGRLTLMLCAGFGFAGANLAVKGFTDHLGAHQYVAAGAYLAASGVGSTAAMLAQMTAFQRHRAVEVVPITFVIPNFLPVLVAVFVLQERWSTAAFAGAPFVAGCTVLALGTLALSRAGPVLDIARRAAI